jgi:hypothetical protein
MLDAIFLQWVLLQADARHRFVLRPHTILVIPFFGMVPHQLFDCERTKCRTVLNLVFELEFRGSATASGFSAKGSIVGRPEATLAVEGRLLAPAV